MEIIREFIGEVAGVLGFTAYLYYMWDIVRYRNNPNKGTKPNRVTWLLLSVVTTLIAVSVLNAGAESTLWLPVGVAAGTILVAILSIPYGTGGRTKFDVWCLGAAVLLILVWQIGIMSDPTSILLTWLLLDLVVLSPTIKHAYESPKEESRLAWSVTVIADMFGVAAVDNWIIDIAAYPVYMFIINGIVTAFLFQGTRRWILKFVATVKNETLKISAQL